MRGSLTKYLPHLHPSLPPPLLCGNLLAESTYPASTQISLLFNYLWFCRKGKDGVHRDFHSLECLWTCTLISTLWAPFHTNFFLHHLKLQLYNFQKGHPIWRLSLGAYSLNHISGNLLPPIVFLYSYQSPLFELSLIYPSTIVHPSPASTPTLVSPKVLCEL